MHDVTAQANRLQEIAAETYNTEFRLSLSGKFSSDNWKMYIVGSRTLFTGTLAEVVQCAIDEFESYRVPSVQSKYVKNYKKYTYRS